MTGLRFYNTLTRKKENFTPIDKACVRLYVCGPTVYDYAHIGNARPVIVFDLLYRLLRHVYGEKAVRYIRNITDVDDKINARAARDYPALPLNKAIAKLTRETEKQFHYDIAALNCLPPSKEPRATDNIETMKAMIARLVQNGHAYVAEDHILFSVAAMNESARGAPKTNPPYGQLSRRRQEEMLAGARVEVAGYKRDAQDFVLWKPSGAGEPGWASPCGIQVLGRPGWHIECSAMSMAELLEPYGGGLACTDPLKNRFDIHGGGLDLIFPHHENEIAQSCCALGAERMANFWLHNGFLQVEGRKMSKSEGNFITIRQILESHLPEFKDSVAAADKIRWAGLAARFSMLQTHYREPLNWTQKRFAEASAELYKWYQYLQDAPARREENARLSVAKSGHEDFLKALADDLNTPQAIAVLRQYYRRGDSAKLAEAMMFLGLINPKHSFLSAPTHALFARKAQPEAAEIAEIEALIEERAERIAQKDWRQADKIRDDLAARGIKLTDFADKKTGKRLTKWELA